MCYVKYYIYNYHVSIFDLGLMSKSKIFLHFHKHCYLKTNDFLHIVLHTLEPITALTPQFEGRVFT